MTFSEEAAELHRLEAVALSLGLSERAFLDIAQEVVTAAHVAGTLPLNQLAEIRRRVHEVAEARIQPESNCQRWVNESGFAR